MQLQVLMRKLLNLDDIYGHNGIIHIVTKETKMVSVERAIDRGVQRSYVSRNGGTQNTFHAFALSQGAVGNKKNEIESSWLIAKGGSGARLNEQWGTYLATKGFTTGILEEKMLAFFRTGTQV